MLAGGDADGELLRDFAGKCIRSVYNSVTMMQEGDVMTILTAIIWEVMLIMMQKTLINPTFDDYLEAFKDPNDPY